MIHTNINKYENSLRINKVCHVSAKTHDPVQYIYIYIGKPTDIIQATINLKLIHRLLMTNVRPPQIRKLLQIILSVTNFTNIISISPYRLLKISYPKNVALIKTRILSAGCLNATNKTAAFKDIHSICKGFNDC